MSSEEQNFQWGQQAGSVYQAGGSLGERGRAAENAYFHAQDAEKIAALKQQSQSQQQPSQQNPPKQK